MASKHRVSVLITDLDNTLYDWFKLWYTAFNAMLESLVEESGIKREQLISDIKKVHERHGTSEYSFLIEEIECLQRQHPNQDLKEVYKAAIDAYRSARKSVMELYPGVLETLLTLRDSGVLIVGYTESMAFYTNYRVRNLGLDGILDYLFSPADHELPESLTQEQVRHYPAQHYELKQTIHKTTPAGELKPNPKLLLDIIRDLGAEPNECIYVGDSLFKDIAMAKEAGVLDAYAEYGVAHQKEEYELLRQVTHWKTGHVETEKSSTTDHINPTYTLRSGLSELLANFEFTPYIKPEARQDNIQYIVEAWKKTIDVQQHFNDIEMKIRSVAVTVLGATLGAAGFSLKEHLTTNILDTEVSIAALLLFVAFIVWIAFYFMDRFWYHQLLYGAVNHGIEIENSLKVILPQLGLTHAIGKTSPLRIFKWDMHSKHKYNVFYGMGAFGIICFFVILMLS